MMSRPTVLNSFHAYGQHAPFGNVVHPGPMYRLPMRPPELPAGYNHQHTGHHARTSTVRMSGPAYMPSDEELAHLQKLSNEFEPEATVSMADDDALSRAMLTRCRARWSESARAAVPSRPSMRMPTPSTE